MGSLLGSKARLARRQGTSRATKEEKEMTEEQEIRASHEEVEGFVEKLREFHGSLEESEQAMLETIVQSAQGQDTGAYAFRIKLSSQGGGWEDLVGWIEQGSGEDTQGFAIRWKG
jgi:hypothetical protein